MCSTASGCMISECSLIPVTVCPCVNKTRRWCFELLFPRCAFKRLEASRRPTERISISSILRPPNPMDLWWTRGIRALCCIPISVFSGIKGKCAEWVQRQHNPRDQRQSIARSSTRPDSQGTSAERKWQANLEAKWCLIQGWRVGGKRKEREDKRGAVNLELGWREDLSTLWWPRARTAVKGRPSTCGVIVIQRNRCSVPFRNVLLFF